MTDARAAVVILNYNNREFLSRFLDGIVANSYPHEVVVVDNGSHDDSVAFVKAAFPQVQVILNGDNYGYSRGYNMALRQIQADYVVLLNSDVEVTQGWLSPIISLMEHDPWIAACQPKLLDYNDRDRFEYAGASGGFIDKLGYPFCRGRIFNTLEKDAGQYDDPMEVFWASGACLALRSKAFWHAGGLDEDFFAHMEEIDLCWRLRNFGYKVYVQPQSVVYHIGGGTLSKISPRKTFLNFRNNLSTLTKNHPGASLPLKIAIRLVLDGVAAIKFLVEGHGLHFIAVIRAHFAYYVRLKKLVAQRRRLRKTGGFQFRAGGMYSGRIVFEYFLKGRKIFSRLKRGFLSDG